ncbi:hypothetical protein ACFL3T_00985 [Patescibacteria group bacterium]
MAKWDISVLQQVRAMEKTLRSGNENEIKMLKRFILDPEVKSRITDIGKDILRRLAWASHYDIEATIPPEPGIKRIARAPRLDELDEELK